MTEKLLPPSSETQKDLPSEVLTQISAIYPFLDERERNEYMEKAVKIEEKDPIKEITALIELLDNPHATIRKLSPEQLSPEYADYQGALPSSEVIDNVLYLRIPSLSGVSLEKIENAFLPYKDKSEGIIIDLRDNMGGNEMPAIQFSEKYLVKEGEHHAGTNIEIAPEGGLRHVSTLATSNNEEAYDKPIVVLANNKTFSSAERFIARLKAGTECILIGTETRGGSANPEMTEIEYKGEHYIVFIPTWRFFLHGEDKPLENTKIKPDILYEDENIVDFAVQHIKKLQT